MDDGKIRLWKTLALFLFIAGVFVFGMSYHNIDLAVNMSNGAIDTNGIGYQQDKTTMYLKGMTGLDISIISMISGFVLLFGMRDEKTHKGGLI